MKGARHSSRGCLLGLAIILVVSELMLNSKVEACGNSWWSLGLFGCDLNSADTKQCRNCAAMRFYNLTTATQEDQCEIDSSNIVSVAKGSRHAILDCQRRFNGSKWNCSTFQSQHIFGEFIEWNTKETALLYSYFLAGSMWALAVDCQSERIVSCPCKKEGDKDTAENGDVIFYKCNANVGYARSFLNDFVLNMQLWSNVSGAQLHWQNSIAGLNIMKKQHQACRCHGISGTCSAQTCQQTVRSVEEAGEELVELYGKAEQVNGSVTNMSDDETSITNLKYKNLSPDFCGRNDTIGVLGVEGRQCKLNHPSVNCTSLCCNRGFVAETKLKDIEVCQFVWCCSVKCVITGQKYETTYHCK